MKALMTEITLRTMIRGAWAVIDISEDISSAGERLEACDRGIGGAERTAHGRRRFGR